jgi:DnaK suppressor protein
MRSLTKKHIETLQGIMEAELARLVHETQDEMNPELKANINSIDGGAADVDDEAVADNIVDTDNAIIGMHLQKARDLNSALDRIQAGVYGMCTDCGDEIGYERLSAYPTAKRCIECQSLHEKTFASGQTSSF